MDRRIMRLSSDAFRAFVLSLAYSVSNRTDGLVDRDDLSFIGCDEQHGAELCSAGLWSHRLGGWLITDYAATQTSRSEFEVLENVRRREREKKHRQRLTAAKVPGDVAAVPGECPPGPVPRDSTGKASASASASAPRGEDAGDPWEGIPIAVPGQAGHKDPEDSWLRDRTEFGAPLAGAAAVEPSSS